MQELHGLRYDYEQRTETCLVFWRENGIKEEELSRIQTKMLQTGQVPRLLPFVAESEGGDTKLVYKIAPRRRLLQQALRADRLSLPLVLQFLVSVAAMLEQCRSYMLRESGFLLEEQFLFVGADISDVYFVYLPLPRAEALPVEQALKRLIARVGEALPPDDRAALAMLAAYCDSEAFRMKELKRHLIEQLTANVAAKGGASEGKGLGLSTPSGGELHGFRSLQPPFEPADMPAAAQAEERERSAARSRLLLIVAVAGATCGLWLWNRCAAFPSAANVHIAIGATLLIADAWLLIRFTIEEHSWKKLGRFRLFKPGRLLPYDDLEDEDEYGVVNESEFAFLADSSLSAGSSFAAGPQPSAGDGEAHDAAVPLSPEANPSYRAELGRDEPSPVRFAAPFPQHAAAESYYASLREQTSLLHPAADATVLLRPAAAPYSRPQAILERCDVHPPQRIALDRSSFVIGRNAEHTDFRLETPDVSRQHVEIVHENGGYAARDLGSTNGTLWNGERMVPFRAYQLQEGDSLTVADVQLAFRFVANARKTV